MPNAKAPAVWGMPAIVPRVGSRDDADGQCARYKCPGIGAASTCCGEGLPDANPDFAARRPGRAERGFNAQGLADGERVCLRIDRAAVVRSDGEARTAFSRRGPGEQTLRRGAKPGGSAPDSTDQDACTSLPVGGFKDTTCFAVSVSE